MRMRSDPRCTSLCDYPCAKDHRTKAEKIQAMVDGATTPGEKVAAQAAAGRVTPDAPRMPRTETINDARRRAWANGARGPVNADSFGSRSRTYTTPTPEEARPAGRQTSQEFFREWSTGGGAFWDEAMRRSNQRAEDELRRAQAEETLRRNGFAMPGDPEFVYYPPGSRGEDPLSAHMDNIADGVRATQEAVLQELLRRGTINVRDAKRAMGMED